MGFKEILLGSNWEQKGNVEKLARISKVIDVGTIFVALVLGGMAPALANTFIQASVVTYAGGEVVESRLERKNKTKS